MTMPPKPPRKGERTLQFDPASTADDGRVVFIGHAATAWKDRDSCPKNMIRARETGQPADIFIKPQFRPGLCELTPGNPIWIFSWMHGAPRNLIVQSPRHRDTPAGVFALRSPSRPNPIGLSRAILTGLDVEAGRLSLDALDCVDGTPVIDIKPVMESADTPTAD